MASGLRVTDQGVHGGGHVSYGGRPLSIWLLSRVPRASRDFETPARSHGFRRVTGIRGRLPLAARDDRPRCLPPQERPYSRRLPPTFSSGNQQCCIQQNTRNFSHRCCCQFFLQRRCACTDVVQNDIILVGLGGSSMTTSSCSNMKDSFSGLQIPAPRSTSVS